MRSKLLARCSIVFLLVAGLVWGMSFSSSAQSGRKPAPSSQPQYKTEGAKDGAKEAGGRSERNVDKPIADTTPVVIDENGTIKLDTSLVTIPVSVIDRDGKFIPNLTRRDFQLYEDGVRQEIESFNSVETPFHVVLLLDTSNSTMFKLEDIQAAAIEFTTQLRYDDQVMVMSFDSRVNVQCQFTSDREELRYAIRRTRTGGSTKLYEAVDRAVDELDRIEGRKAIVLFTDGVDTSSRRANYRNTLERVEESGAIAYPISYDTALDHQQGGVIMGNPRGRPPVSNPWPLPSPRGRRWPLINHQFPQGRWPGGGGVPPGQRNGGDDYVRAARYLQELADRSGGRLFKADTLRNLADAFSMIAEELRHQYALSYYPTNATKDGSYRRVKVTVEKTGAIIRAREGYRAAAETQAKSSEDATGRPELKRKQLAVQ